MTLSLASILSLPLIGEGNFRRVYRAGDHVYKVEYGEGIDLECNRNEYANALTLSTRRLPVCVDVPNFRLLTIEGIPVILSDYVEGEVMGECTCVPGDTHLGCLPRNVEAHLNALGIDAAYGNVIRDGSTYYLVDLDADLR